MHYVLIHTMDEGLDVSDVRAARIEVDLRRWLDDTIPSGVNLQGSRLRPTGDATTVRVSHDDVMITDGPFAETKEQVVGYDILECPSLDEALTWAARHPTAVLGAIEVRSLDGTATSVTLPDPRPGTQRYVMLVCVREGVELSADEAAAMGPATDAWVSECDARGTRLFGSALAPRGDARTLRVIEGQLMVSDGPFAETKEFIAGFDVLECADLDEALDVATRHPVARIGALELRPFW